MPLFMEMPGKPDGPAAPPLPLRESITAEAAASFPDDVLDAIALRPLLDAVLRAYDAAIAEFDAVFGGRA
jgi:hypothetical protein